VHKSWRTQRKSIFWEILIIPDNSRIKCTFVQDKSEPIAKSLPIFFIDTDMCKQYMLNECEILNNPLLLYIWKLYV